jgi:hypothetical protein
MKKIVFLVVLFCMISNPVLAACDFSHLVHNPDGSVTYPAAAHLCVGQLVQDNATKDQQIVDYKKALTLKDLAVTAADARADLWLNTSLKLEGTVQNIDKLKKDDQWISFGLGALTVIGAGLMAAQLSRAH